MQLTAFVDLNGRREHPDSDIPCQESDAELWFEQSPADVEFAKALCGACPVRTECLAGALSREEPWGVGVGSFSSRERSSHSSAPAGVRARTRLPPDVESPGVTLAPLGVVLHHGSCRFPPKPMFAKSR